MISRDHGLRRYFRLGTISLAQVRQVKTDDCSCRPSVASASSGTRPYRTPFEVRFADGGDCVFFYWDDVASRRLRPELLRVSRRWSRPRHWRGRCGIGPKRKRRSEPPRQRGSDRLTSRAKHRARCVSEILARHPADTGDRAKAGAVPDQGISAKTWPSSKICRDSASVEVTRGTIQTVSRRFVGGAPQPRVAGGLRLQAPPAGRGLSTGRLTGAATGVLKIGRWDWSRLMNNSLEAVCLRQGSTVRAKFEPCASGAK
jgi:hypothetical protein